MSNKIAVVIYESTNSGDARAYRGLKTAIEFQEAGDDVVVVFDGSGVETLAAISDPTNPMHPLAEKLRSNILGACSYCAKAHKSAAAIQAAGWTLLTDNNGEASIRNLVQDGRQILNF
ncbi:sulfur reduction protein DsrE [Microbacterium sp. NPDC076768]|uniref:DsrE family protein n=1 Tax=Microbacterium sp. NPDC076768 TaxID=3154858 RepID=UPI0034396559